MPRIADARSEPFLARIPAGLKIRLEREAKRTGLSQNLVVRRALEEYLKGGKDGR